MKLIIIIGVTTIVIILAVLIVTQNPKQIGYIAPTASTIEIKEVVKQENVLQSRIKKAQEEKKVEIEANAEKVRLASITQANVEIELEVTTAFRKEIEAREKELQAQSVAY